MRAQYLFRLLPCLAISCLLHVALLLIAPKPWHPDYSPLKGGAANPGSSSQISVYLSSGAYIGAQQSESSAGHLLMLDKTSSDHIPFAKSIDVADSPPLRTAQSPQTLHSNESFASPLQNDHESNSLSGTESKGPSLPASGLPDQQDVFWPASELDSVARPIDPLYLWDPTAPDKPHYIGKIQLLLYITEIGTVPKIEVMDSEVPLDVINGIAEQFTHTHFVPATRHGIHVASLKKIVVCLGECLETAPAVKKTEQ